MPAATTKSDLIARCDAEINKLLKVIEPIDRATALRKRDDNTSIKDVVAHRAHWIRLFLGWSADGQAGRTVYFPAQGFKWSDLKSYNALLRDRQADLGWGDARAKLLGAHAALRDFLEHLPQEALYGGPMKDARNTWTPGRWAEAAGPSHYRSAAKWIRACLRADSKAP